ncbi:MAG: 5'-methylthioadenosine/adenosylhomocysteine nucleosidase [Lachnospiraceae bacterium]|nr:5'-methylthioadenosine/adenosylhomocysteine nucleosidase [Lachnospiraceae bacterium]
MKKIGIIGAMEEEVDQLKAKMTWVQVTTKASMEFNEGKLADRDVVVVRSGIGKVNAAICAQILVDDFGVDTIWNTGIAGSLKSEINIGDIVISTDALQHDMDATQFGYVRGQIPRMDTFSFPADETLIDLAVKCCGAVNPDIQVFRGRVVSGDQFVADAARKTDIVDTFAGYCTEMEGAAIAQAAYLNKIPYVVIRAISDKADNSATMDYPTFEKQAIRHTVNLVEEMVKTIA